MEKKLEKLDWTPDMSVGVRTFDEQHKRVILMINRLIDVLSATTNSQEVADMLDKMTKYTSEHLREEESLMAQHGYPLFEQHKAEHVAYIKKTVDFCTATQIGVDGIAQGLLIFLRSWWEHHIQNSDKAYSTFFNGIGIS